MPVFIIISFSAFLVTLLCTPVAIRAAHKTGFLDYPSGNLLKIHRLPTPLLGGLGVLCGCLAALVLGVIFLKSFQRETAGLIIALLILFFMGLLDDSRGLTPSTRLLGQLSAALIVIGVCGFSVKLIPLGPISIAITIFYLIGATNAINLIDGMDGLATGITMVASIGFCADFMAAGNLLGILISSGLLGATLGFLIFNVNPAKIFLGDNGSTVLGFLLGTLAVLYSAEPFSITHFLFPLLILLVPIVDTGSAIGRRALMHKPLFHGDRDHLYDQLARKGFSQRQVMLIMCSLGLAGACAATLLALD